MEFRPGACSSGNANHPWSWGYICWTDRTRSSQGGTRASPESWRPTGCQIIRNASRITISVAIRKESGWRVSARRKGAKFAIRTAGRGWIKEVKAAIKNLQQKVNRMPKNSSKRQPLIDAINRGNNALKQWGE